MMKNPKAVSLFCAAIGMTAALAMPRFAAAQSSEVAAGAITSSSLGSGEWQYDITLSNHSTADNANTTIGTFWFSWVPGNNFMQAVPTDIVAPTGWTATITGPETTPDGSAIQFVNMNGDLLHAGSSLSGFQFDSTETPAQIAGPSPFAAHQPETTSAAYIGAPFTDSTVGGDLFTVQFASTDNPPPNTDGGNPPPTDNGGGNGNNGTTPPGGVSAVPLPAAFGQTMIGLIGLGLISGVKKWVKRPEHT